MLGARHPQLRHIGSLLYDFDEDGDSFVATANGERFSRWVQLIPRHSTAGGAITTKPDALLGFALAERTVQRNDWQ